MNSLIMEILTAFTLLCFFVLTNGVLYTVHYGDRRFLMGNVGLSCDNACTENGWKCDFTGADSISGDVWKQIMAPLSKQRSKACTMTGTAARNSASGAAQIDSTLACGGWDMGSTAPTCSAATSGQSRFCICKADVVKQGEGSWTTGASGESCTTTCSNILLECNFGDIDTVITEANLKQTMTTLKGCGFTGTAERNTDVRPATVDSGNVCHGWKPGSAQPACAAKAAGETRFCRCWDKNAPPAAAVTTTVGTGTTVTGPGTGTGTTIASNSTSSTECSGVKAAGKCWNNAVFALLFILLPIIIIIAIVVLIIVAVSRNKKKQFQED